MPEDHQFHAGTGYSCILPYLKLFVERDGTGWTAYICEPSAKRGDSELSKQEGFPDSASAKQHCLTFANSWRVAAR
jgi:hypothetical protein